MSGRSFFPEKFEGRHVLMALLGFFGLMIVANGIFLYYALGTFNGFETRDAYSRGLTYNSRIASDNEQTQRGWKSETSYDRRAGELVALIREPQGRGVAGLNISAEIRRPATDREDLTVAFTELRPGQYGASAKLAPGQWIVIGEARRGQGGELAYRFKHRLWVKEAP